MAIQELGNSSHSENIVFETVPDVPYFAPKTNPSPGSYIRPHRDSSNKSQPHVFRPITLRNTTFKNRLFISPMCQYSAETGTGLPNDWHLVHTGQYAIRGYGLVVTEATAVLPNGRISPQDLGIWSDDHIPSFKRITDFVHSQGSLAGIQLAHAGRKASTYAPWLLANDIRPEDVKSVVVPVDGGGWSGSVWGPSSIAFDDKHALPHEMTLGDIETYKNGFIAAIERSLKAGYDVLEIHGAHGYLLHNFYSPISNKRTDKYGGSFENRTRLILEIAKIARDLWPKDKPVFVRISATEYHEKGEKDSATGEWISWGIEQSILLCKALQELGIDLIDVSSGGNYAEQHIALEPGYQVPFSEQIRKGNLEIKTSTVGLITSPQQAEDILQQDKADVIFLGREVLRNADFLLDTANKLESVVSFPSQYIRSLTRMFAN